MRVHSPNIRASSLTLCSWLYILVCKKGGVIQADDAVCTEFWLPETLDASRRLLALKAAKSWHGNEGYICPVQEPGLQLSQILQEGRTCFFLTSCVISQNQRMKPTTSPCSLGPTITGRKTNLDQKECQQAYLEASVLRHITFSLLIPDPKMYFYPIPTIQTTSCDPISGNKS